MAVHELKTWSPFYEHTADGSKPFEIRKDDRYFEVGDVLVLRQYDPNTRLYSAGWQMVVVTYIVRAEGLAEDLLKPGVVVMGTRPASAQEECTALRDLRAWNPNWPG